MVGGVVTATPLAITNSEKLTTTPTGTGREAGQQQPGGTQRRTSRCRRASVPRTLHRSRGPAGEEAEDHESRRVESERERVLLR